MRVRTHRKCFIANQRHQPGDIFEYDGPPAEWLEPMEPKQKADKPKAEKPRGRKAKKPEVDEAFD